MAATKGYLGAFYLSKQNAVSTSGGDITVADPTGGELDFASDASFSVEAWMTPNSDVSNIGDLVSKGSILSEVVLSDTGVGWFLGFTGGKPIFQTNDASTSDVVAGATDVANNNWVHLVGVRDVANDRIRIYTDAVAANTATLTAGDLSNTSDLVFGDPTNTNAIRVGLVRIYSAALTDAQISDLWKGNFPGAVLGDLEGEWMFHEGAGTFGDDSSKNSNDAVVGGDGWVTTTYNTETTEALTSDSGSTTVYRTAYENVEYENLTVVSGGVTQVLGQDFSITPKGSITFKTSQAGEAVTATYRHYPMTVECGGFTSWSLDIAADMMDDTDFRSTGWRTFKAGLKGWTGSADRYWINPLGYGVISKRCILRFYTDEDTGNYLSGWGIVSGISPSAAVDTLITDNLTFQGSMWPGTETT